ncbi:hypothetical protein [Idiomarina ramblicola]|uniref:Uncharacterized protein n=1 Tax=Idiomarina ramblicola TaxID=263724 RepID=A0A432Z1K8_9GAMM|nr:hypothetical protein [Idiomarina ramblicola]RUO71776.1 hypothetical protein CWI78_04470 [Idiomarina ramblicola]
MKTINKKWWAVLMTALATIYLFPEMIFNAELVTTAGSANASADDIHQLELFGRAISGIGVTLLILDAIKTFPLASKFKTLLLSLGIFLMVWPVVFFGQKALIDTLIIDSSTAEERQTAFLSIIVKNALAAKAVDVDGLPFDSDNPASPVSRTFLSLFGGLVYANDNVLNQIKQSKEALATAYVVNQTRDKVDNYVDQHHQLAGRLNTAYYDNYLPAYNDYKSAIVNSQERANEEWQKVEQQLTDGWAEYQKLTEAADDMATQQAAQAAPRIYKFLDTYFDGCVRNGKPNTSCRARAVKRYNQQITRLGYGEIPFQYWLIEEEVGAAENWFNTIAGAVLTGGATLAVQGLDAITGGDGGFKDKRYKYTKSEQHYKQRIAAYSKFQQQFVDKHGYPPFLNRQQFNGHEQTSRTIRAELEKSGIKLADTWTLTDRRSFDTAVVQKITSQAMSRWSKALDDKAVDLPPGLSWRQFHQHNEVLAYINRHVNGITLTRYNPEWSDEQFKRFAIEPQVRQQVDNLLSQLASSQAEFADGGSLEQQGKQSLRAVIVPPISMAISLLLVCLTLIKLPLRYLQLAISEPSKPVKAAFAAVPIVTAVLVIYVPLKLLQPGFAQQYPGAAVFLDAVETSANGFTATSLEWTLKTQPLIYPVGHGMANLVNFKQTSQVITEPLAELDEGFAKIDLSLPLDAETKE